MFSNKKSMIISIVLIVAILAATLVVFILPPLLTEKFDEELVVYNWADYIEVSVLDDFAEYYEEVTGKSLKVVYTNFDTNETMLTEIIRGDSNIDLICPSEYAIEKLIRSGAVKKLDWSILDEYPEVERFYKDNINHEITDKIDTVFSSIETPNGTANMNDYFLPYMWGTLGILYNKNYVTVEQVEEAGWGIFWNETNIPEIEGKILIKDSIRDTYCAAVMYLCEYGKLPAGYEDMSPEDLINCTDEELVAAVENALREQKKHLKGYEVDFGKDDMVREIALVDLAWSGDAMYAIEEAEDDEGESYLGYYAPEIGGNVWFDGWVMPNSCKNTLAAHMFMNYLCDPEIAMRNGMEIGYTTAVSKEAYDKSEAAKDYLYECYEVESDDGEFFEEFFGDEGRYPQIAGSNLGMMRDFGAQNEKVVVMWERVKAHGETRNWATLGIIIGIIAGAVLIVVGIILWKFYKKPRMRKVTKPKELNESVTQTE